MSGSIKFSHLTLERSHHRLEYSSHCLVIQSKEIALKTDGANALIKSSDGHNMETKQKTRAGRNIIWIRIELCDDETSSKRLKRNGISLDIDTNKR